MPVFVPMAETGCGATAPVAVEAVPAAAPAPAPDGRIPTTPLRATRCCCHTLRVDVVSDAVNQRREAIEDQMMVDLIKNSSTLLTVCERASNTLANLTTEIVLTRNLRRRLE